MSTLVLLTLCATCVSQPLKICADPDNLPFSSREQSGFDNQIANLIADRLGRRVEFTWVRMGRGFIREYINKGQCELLFGVPKGMRGLLLTRPYYRSSYMFVTRRNVVVDSLNAPALRRMQIGIQVLDDDYAPPARALARRGMTSNIQGFDMEDPGAMLNAVASGKIDAAIIWGPTAGYYARKSRGRFRFAPVRPEFDPPGLPFLYDITVGVRKSDPSLFEQVDAAVAASAREIQRILRRYNIPTIATSSGAVGGQQ